MVLQRDSFNYYTSLHQHQDQYQYSSLVGERGGHFMSVKLIILGKFVEDSLNIFVPPAKHFLEARSTND